MTNVGDTNQQRVLGLFLVAIYAIFWIFVGWTSHTKRPGYDSDFKNKILPPILPNPILPCTPSRDFSPRQVKTTGQRNLFAFTDERLPLLDTSESLQALNIAPLGPPYQQLKEVAPPDPIIFSGTVNMGKALTLFRVRGQYGLYRPGDRIGLDWVLITIENDTACLENNDGKTICLAPGQKLPIQKSMQ